MLNKIFKPTGVWPDLLTACLFMLAMSPCYGQNDWRPGYIIHYRGDTLHGYIDYRDSKSNSKQCYFRNELKGITREFTPADIAGYRFVNGVFFVSKKIGGQNYDTPVFLEFLIQGRLNVYHFKDENDRYFVEKDSNLIELRNTADVKKINGLSYLENNKEYIRILTYLLKDAGIQPDIQKTSLEANSLVSIAKEYHEKVCTDESCMIYKWEKPPFHIRKEIYAGFFLNRINFGGQAVSGFTPGAWAGVRFELENLFAWSKNLSLSADLRVMNQTDYKLTALNNYDNIVTYHNVKYNLTTAPYNSYSTVIKSLRVNLETMTVSIPLIVNYTLSNGRLKPSLGAGFTNIFVVSQNKDFIYQRFQNEFNHTIPVYQYGFIGRAGLTYDLKNKKSLSAEVIGEYTQTGDIYRILNLMNTTFAVNLGFGF